MSAYCTHCGASQPEFARYCPSCGKQVGSPDPPGTKRPRNQRRSHPASVAVLAVLVVVGFLYVLNNTSVGVSLKCHLFGDVGACFVQSMTDPAPMQDILNKLGTDI